MSDTLLADMIWHNGSMKSIPFSQDKKKAFETYQGLDNINKISDFSISFWTGYSKENLEIPETDCSFYYLSGNMKMKT